jgi:hypothetical protein
MVFEKLAFIRTAREIMHGNISIRIESIAETAPLGAACRL